MKRLLHGIIILIAFGACNSAKHVQKFYFPPQWEPHQSVWLGWAQDSSLQQVQLEIAKAVNPHVGLTILSRSASLLKTAFLQLSTAGIDTTKVKGYVHYIPNVFIRDAGPRFLKSASGQLAIADLGWNNYGYPKEFDVSQYSDKRGTIDNELAGQMKLQVVSTPIVGEGGGLEVSTNTMICFSEMALQRNPGKSLEEIEKEYLRVYGKQKMIWLNRMPVMDKVVAGPKAGNYFGYGANGHIDEFVRFVNDSTLVISLIDSSENSQDPISNADYAIMQENLHILRQARDINGKPFKIISLPTPSYSLYSDKEILTDSLKNNGDGKAFFKEFKSGDEIFWLNNVGYANFFITNGIVLVAKYWKEGLPEKERLKDEEARQTLQEIFPTRKIIQINPMALNRNGGGMNCGTQQQPK